MRTPPHAGLVSAALKKIDRSRASKMFAEQLGRAMSDANKAHVLNGGREMNFRELGQVAADVAQHFFTGLVCPVCANPPLVAEGASK